MAMAMRRCSISFLSHRRLSTAAAVAPPPPPPSPATPSVSSRKATSLLKSSVKAESDPEKIFALIQSSTNLPPIPDDRHLYRFSVNKLARLNRQDLVERLLESPKFAPAASDSESFFIRIISLYAHASMPEHALRTFERIPSRTEQSVCALLNAYLKQRLYDRVRELFDRIPAQYGIVPGITTHNVLLSSLCMAGELQTARKLLDEMFGKKEFKPNISSYNMLLGAYLKNEDEASFDAILQEIGRKGVAYNISTYNIRISNFCKKKEFRRAEELLDELLSNGIPPVPVTFSAIIEGFCKEGDLDSALRVCNRMKTLKILDENHPILPCAGTCMALLQGLVNNGDYTSALPICEECLKRNLPPPFAVVKALASELVKDSKPEQAKALVSRMRKAASGCAMDAWAKFEAQLSL